MFCEVKRERERVPLSKTSLSANNWFSKLRHNEMHIKKTLVQHPPRVTSFHNLQDCNTTSPPPPSPPSELPRAYWEKDKEKKRQS